MTEPRNWETRKASECAAIVRVDGRTHFACCAPVVDGWAYCEDHKKRFFIPAQGGEKELVRSVKRMR